MSSPNENESKNVIDKAKEFIHDTVKTDQQRQAEKPVHEQVADKMPGSAKEAGANLDKAVSDAKKDQKDKNLMDMAGEKFNEAKDFVGGKTLEAREAIADATKPSNKDESFSAEKAGEKIDEAAKDAKEKIQEKMDQAQK